MLAVERITAMLQNDDNAMTTSDLAQMANALGRISGVATTDLKVSGTIAHEHIAALRSLTASARIAQPADAQHVTALPSGAETGGGS